MSNKPRRDITLGEMQDECSFRGDNCETIGGDKCKFFEVCATMQTIDKGCLTPIMWNLTDPTRFNEAQQLRFWESWYGIGARKATIELRENAYFIKLWSEDLRVIGTATVEIACMPLDVSTTLDLAELLGKDGSDEKT